MKVFAIADLHLALGLPEKKMDFFGEPWINYTDKIEQYWKKTVSQNDLVLIPGDISWASSPEDAKIDLEWIHQLPGTKVLLKGNHDHWWSSLNKVQKVLPSSMHLIQNNSFYWNDIAIGGTRLWDSKEYNFDDYINYVPNPRANLNTVMPSLDESEKIFERELTRLEASLKTMNKDAKIKIAMTHYPPIGLPLAPSRTVEILEKYGINFCIFGHLHNVKEDVAFGKFRNVEYRLIAADYLKFIPSRII